MKIPTIYDIKHDIQEKSPHFFSRNILKFFGQTMKSFHVVQSPEGRIFIFAIMRPEFTRRGVGYTFREYVDHDLIVVHDDNGQLISSDIPSLEYAAIMSYINTH